MPRPIIATIHLDAITNNLAIARRHAPSAKLWAVVKANAYGHGIARVYPALTGADGFALLDLAEAEQLREIGWRKPILLLEGFFEAGDVQSLADMDLTTVVHCEDQLQMLESAASQLPSRAIDIYLKLNSGMNRLGFTAYAYRKAWHRLSALPFVRNITHMTHFSDADTDKGIAEQMEQFRAATCGLPGPVSVANSAGVLWHPSSHREWIRAGVMLYGASPSGSQGAIAGLGLGPTMTLRSKLLAVQTVAAGQAVGYGSQFTAATPLRIGIVGCGYADGYPRNASSHVDHFAPVRVGNQMTRTIGRVSMDMLAVDLTQCPQARVGTEVELWGKNVPIDAVATAAGTIGYELMCSLAARVPVVVETLTDEVAP